MDVRSPGSPAASFMGWDEPIGKSVSRALQAATSVIASSAPKRINDA